MRRKKGFTLIELLAVIVILAIIALIATPIILKIVEDAKKDAFLRSVELVVSTTDIDIAMKTFEEEYTYNITDGTVSNLEIGIKNTQGMNGSITYNKEGEVSYTVHNDKWCVVKTGNSEASITKYEGSCAIGTDVSAFTYEEIIVAKSLEAGDNCVNYFKENKKLDDTEATNYCNGEKVSGFTLIEDINISNSDITQLQEAGAIKNVVTSSAIKIIGYDVDKGGVDVIIPSKIDNKPVVSIGNRAFYNNQLTSVTIPNSVISIGNSTFRSNQLTSVTIPDSVISMGYYAFRENQLTSIILGNSLTSIGDNAFRSNQLTSVAIPDNVTIIKYQAFEDNQLTSITLPDGAISIGYAAFNNNQLPDSQAFIYARNSDGSVDNSTIISYGGAKRNDVVIPQGVVNIGIYAFASNQLTSVTIPNGVRYIGEAAFDSNQLTSVTIPDSVTSLSGFSWNQLTSITIPDSVTTIGNRAFLWNSLTSVAIPNSVTSIGNDAFSSNKLDSATIGNSVISIGECAFCDNQLTSLTIGNNVASIEESAFERNKLTSVTMPNSVTGIGKLAFAQNKLTSVTIENGSATIGCNAFFSNSSLTTINYGGTNVSVSTGLDSSCM